jgi:molybdate transport system ATP-binding protein
MTEASVHARVRLDREAFRLDVALEAPERGITGILGASGSGKTTLLRCIAGLEPDCEGEVRVRGALWQGAGVFRPPHQRAVGYVFQEARLFPHLSVLGNLRYGMNRTDAPLLPLSQVVELLGLERLLHSRPVRLSGGEQQRVAIGRALLRNPSVVLMDEPLANLDALRKLEILPFLERLHARLTVPIVYVSHSVEEVSRLCDRLLVLKDGRVEADGELHTVFGRPDLSLPLGEEAGVILDGEVLDYESSDELTRVTTSAGELLVPGRHGAPGARMRLRILARDVSLTLKPPEATTILNVLPAEIESLHEHVGGFMDVRLRAGRDWLLARISRRSCAALGLRGGAACYAQLKGVAVRGDYNPS